MAGTVMEEIIANGIGFIAGILSIDILKLFFIERKWTNAWGLFSKKTAVSGTTFSLLEWMLTAVIGFVVMMLVNKYVRRWIFRKRYQKESETNKAKETDGDPFNPQHVSNINPFSAETETNKENTDSDPKDVI